MKRALRKDFFREIRRNFGRFISIFFIIALGSAFYAGVRSAKYDMKYSGDTYYDSVNLMDIRVLSTLGLDGDDLADMQKAEGVKAVTGGFTYEAFCQSGDRELTVQLIGRTTDVNQPTVTEGRLPKNQNECMVDVSLLEKSKFKIGDTIAFRSGTEEPLEDSLKQDTFTIVGACRLPNYMDISRGNGTIGDGTIDAFVLLEPEAFSLEMYTEAYVQVEGGKELFCFSDAYKDKVEAVEDRLKELEDTACQRRYENIQTEASEKLADAKQEIADGEKELQDAGQELKDGQEKLAEAEATIEEKEQELQDGINKIADGEQQLADGEQQIADGEQQLKAGQKQLDEKAAQLADSKKTLQQSQASYEAGLQEFNSKSQEIQQVRAQIEQAKDGLAQIESQVPNLDETMLMLQQQLDGIQETIEMLVQQKKQMEEELAGAGEDGSESEAYQQLCQQLAAALEGQQKMQGQYAQLTMLKAQKEQLQQAVSMEPQIAEGEAQIAASKEQLDNAKTQLDEGISKLEEGEAAIASAQAELDKQKKNLVSAKNEIADKKEDLEAAKRELADGEQAMADGKAELAEKRRELLDGQKTYDEESADAQEKLTDAKQEVADSEKKLAELKVPKWYVLNRDKISSYVSYDMDSDRMGNIGEVFPVLFFLVAALVSLTAMTRMIEEQRTAIGTLKALGYSDFVIAMKYFSYAMLATVSGSILGVLVGSVSLPWIILNAYGMLYSGLTKYLTPLNWDQAALAILASVASTGLATLVASYRELRAKPAQLMRPEAPKGGKRVLLERIPFIWKRLNFTQKSTIRNLVRYKKRFLMTVIGIGGCMALMLVGYGLQDSITVVAKNQYTEIFCYDATVSLNTDANAEEKEDLLSRCTTENGVEGCLEVYSKSLDLEQNGKTKDATFVVPEGIGDIEEYVKFQNRITHKAYAFPTDGVILTEKTAKMLDVSVGDTITIVDDDQSVSVKVSVVTENYVYHYVYMSPELYQNLFGKTPEYNQLWINTAFSGDNEREALGKDLLNRNACAGLIFISEHVNDIDYMLDTLNEVIYILIISAGLLAFVVLYNLNSINITERQRELATLKVLGFFDKEVSAYVYRENIILTLLGIAAGCVMGLMLHQFVIQTVEVDAMMFGRLIRPFSFLISGVWAMLFSLLVNTMMSRRLKKIDMIESLKSVE